MSELKPCPFCGGEAQINYGTGTPDGGTCAVAKENADLFSVTCTNADGECIAVETSEYWDEDSAIAAWNTRVSPEGEALEKIRGLAMDSGNVLGARMAEIITIATAALGEKP